MTGNRRTAYLRVRLRPAELDAWRAAAAASEQSLSDWLRARVALRGPLAAAPRRREPVPPGARELAQQLARLGNLTNQLARHAHTTGAIPAAIELAGIRRELARLRPLGG